MVNGEFCFAHVSLKNGPVQQTDYSPIIFYPLIALIFSVKAGIIWKASPTTP